MIKKLKLRLWQRSELIQSSTTTDMGQNMGKWQNHKKTQYKFPFKREGSPISKVNLSGDKRYVFDVIHVRIGSGMPYLQSAHLC